MFSKKIVAAAALLALAVGAQAQVKVYGQLDMSVGKFKAFEQESSTLKSVTKVESGVMSTGSFIGFAGTEDLGGGLKAHFVLESFIGADTGAASGSDIYGEQSLFWGRSSHVALTGGFGKVALGQYDSPLYTLLTSFSPFGDSQVFAPNQVLHYGSGILATSSATSIGLYQGTSWVNSITYETPDMSGFKAVVQYAPKENAGDGSDGNKNNVALGASYTAGPLAVSLAHTSTGENDNGFYDYALKTTGLAASYDFGVANVSGIYTKSKENYGSNDSGSKFYQVGATVPVTAAGKVMVAYGQRKFDDSPEKIKQFSLGYEHNLSKRTSVYAAAGNLKVSFSNSSLKSTNYAFGIKHNF